MKKYLLIIIISFFACTNANAGDIRLGVLHHDVKKGFKLKQSKKREKGINIIGEYIFSDDYKFLYGLPHVGTSINTKGYISNLLYTGLTWRVDFCKEILFSEFSFGFSINNGGRKRFKGKRKAVGSNILFRESLSLGINLTDNTTVSAMFEHMSNAGLAKPNSGINDIGIRFGFRF